MLTKSNEEKEGEKEKKERREIHLFGLEFR